MDTPISRTVLLAGAAPDQELLRPHLASYRIAAVSRGCEALDFLREQKTDCLILSFSLPDMTAAQVLRELQQDETARCGIVILASQNELEAAAQCLEKGAHDFVVRERISPAEVRRAVENAMEKVTLRRDLAAQKDKRQLSDARLHESNERLRLALQGGGLGVWEWDLITNLVTLDARLCHLFGIAPENAHGDASQIFRRIHRDDLPAMQEAVRNATEQKAFYESTFRVLNDDGSLRYWLRGLGRAQFDADGAAHYMMGVNEDISAETEAANAIARSEAHWRAVADNLGCMIAVLSPQGEVSWVNQSALRASDLPLEAFRGRHFAVIPPWNFNGDAGEKVADAIAQAARGHAVRYDTQAHLNGEVVELDFMVAPLCDEAGQVTHLIASGIDISERKRAEVALRDSEELARRVLESTPDCVKILDLNGYIQEINGPGCALLELDDFKALRNQFWPAIWPVETQDTVKQAVEKARGGETSRFSSFRSTFTGAPKWWDTIVTPIVGSDGRVMRLLASSRDISAAKTLESEREAVLQREQAARAELENINRAKDEFLATLSHELRTPLTSIIGWMEILRGGADAELRARGYEVIERNARAQQQLIEDILDVSRIITGQLNLKKAMVEARVLVEAALETLHFAARAKNLVIQTDLEEVPPLWGDAARLQQVMWNLLSNAIKFTPPGGTIRVALREQNGRAILKIEDSGAGIAPEFLPHIFDRFRQADSSSTRQHSGLGLGLAIVKHLVELHDGHIWAHSDGIGRGATFTAEFPLP